MLLIVIVKRIIMGDLSYSAIVSYEHNTRSFGEIMKIRFLSSGSRNLLWLEEMINILSSDTSIMLNVNYFHSEMAKLFKFVLKHDIKYFCVKYETN
jgi:hypothetical protein